MEGIKREKLKGGNVDIYIHTSNVMITGLNLDDKWRQSRLEGQKTKVATEPLKEAPKDTPKEKPKDKPKEKPKDTPKEKPKDTPKEKPKPKEKTSKPSTKKTKQTKAANQAKKENE